MVMAEKKIGEAQNLPSNQHYRASAASAAADAASAAAAAPLLLLPRLLLQLLPPLLLPWLLLPLPPPLSLLLLPFQHLDTTPVTLHAVRCATDSPA
jgi:hypothetical protein